MARLYLNFRRRHFQDDASIKYLETIDRYLYSLNHTTINGNSVRKVLLVRIGFSLKKITSFRAATKIIWSKEKVFKIWDKKNFKVEIKSWQVISHLTSHSNFDVVIFGEQIVRNWIVDYVCINLLFLFNVHDACERHTSLQRVMGLPCYVTYLERTFVFDQR